MNANLARFSGRVEGIKWLLVSARPVMLVVVALASMALVLGAGHKWA